ncbi:hypothetical protein UCDDA912_g03008 [Diaporthe ampelina]|uniref:Ubiquitination network signaling protein n=1 Tax=Diaporthe ampelina TaxID=1214573 RepID=A0A0G2HQ37_9PEZI|nr:hypothetical protein UCDDA912_g03008 [Diaporthe ampelina]
MSLDTARRPSVAAYSETSSSESVSLETSQAAGEDAHRRIDVNSAKNNNVHRDTGFVDLAFTVLRSCPLHDTIAILIILMQLSPVALSSIYMLFTLLTFVPPVTTSSGLSLTEIFDGPGAPNLWTLVGLDLFFLIVFAFMPLQDLILDFAQVVIAMTLGGGASSRAGTTHNIFLCAGIVLFNHFGHHQAINSDGKGPSYVDTSKPFYVKVNNAIWQPTRIMPIDDGEEEGVQGTRWTGDIFGLTPMSNYECQFVSSRTGKAIFSTSLRTIPAKIKDNDALKAPAPRSQYRHQSPATTLRTSIAGLEQKLNDEKARLKSLRRDNNRKTNALKKDIDRLTSAVQSAGGNDEKLRQKIAQNMTQQKQAEQAIAELQEQVKDLQSIPEEVLADYRKKQGQYNSEKGQFDQAKGAFKSFKHSVDQDAKALDDERTSLQAKRTKIAARLNKVDGEHARITDANARGLDEADRRRQETAAFESEAARREQEYADRLAIARVHNDDKTQNAANMATMLEGILNNFNQAEYAAFYERQEAAAYHNAASQWPQYAQNHTWSPATSAALPNSTLATAPAPNPLFSHGTFPQYQHASHVPLPRRSRGRSSSMLSDVSGFTQSTDDENDGSNGSNNNSSGYINAATMTRGSSTINATAAPFLPPAHSHSASQSPFGQYAYPAGDLRSPPGFPPFLPGDAARKVSGSGSGSGSGSVRSGIASSEGSNKDPTSPYPKRAPLSV